MLNLLRPISLLIYNEVKVFISISVISIVLNLYLLIGIF